MPPMGLRRTVGGLGLRLGAAVVRVARRGARGPLRDLRPASVLACSPLRIGDAVQVEPALRALRSAWPDARLTVALRPLVAPLGPAFEIADAVATYRSARDLRRALPARPDVAVSFGLRFGAAWSLWRTGAARTVGYDDAGRGMLLSDPVAAPPWVNRPVWEYPTLAPWPQARFWLELLAAAGLPAAVDPRPRLRVPADAAAVAAALLADAGLGQAPFVVGHAGAEPSYRWDAPRWGALLSRLRARGIRVALGGAAADRPVVDAVRAAAPSDTVDLCGRTPLPVYLAVLARARAVLSVDTSAAHLAAAVGTPVVVLFGAGDPRIWGPDASRGAVVQGVNDDCFGCKRAHCFRPRHYCMDAVGVDDVWRAVEARLPQ